ncbi:MAG: translocation/assembly module TamB domain-containing protein, partial [Terracidiphilus sp.]
KPGEPAIDRLFDLKAGHAAVEQGVLDYDDRAAAFDYQDRRIPLDFTVRDLALQLTYVPARSGSSRQTGTPGSYQIHLTARDLDLVRGRAPAAASVRGFVEASIDLTRATATLSSLRITARSRGVADRSLQISGFLDNFAHPNWQARIVGDLDMRLLDPLTGYPDAPRGIAHLNFDAAGRMGSFRVDGGIHVEDGSYIGTGVVATGVRLDAHLHADPEQLLISSIAARLRTGGEIDGNLSLAPWLTPIPGEASLRPARAAAEMNPGRRIRPDILPEPPSPPTGITIPVNGKVTAEFKGVSLDTILEMVSDPPFQHLGFDTRVNGPATARWTGGDSRTLAVEAQLNLTPPAGSSAARETPVSGRIDATYTQRDGAVDLRAFDLDTPASQLRAHGHLGAYPLTSPSALNFDFQTHNLSEFDTLLRDLAPARGGNSGTSGLPIVLSGQAGLHGSWTGSLVDPHLAGNLQANHLAIKLPASLNSHPGQPPTVQFDTVEVSGSYSAARINIAKGILRRGAAEIALSGSLQSHPVIRVPHGRAPVPSFDDASALGIQVHASQISLEELRPFLRWNLPATGTLAADLRIAGSIGALSGSGWVDLDHGSVCGEPITSIRAQGNLTRQILTLASVTVNAAPGRFSASGSYAFPNRRFQVQARGAGIDLSRVAALRRHGLAASGKLGFVIDGSGTPDDPQIQARATLASLIINGEPFGALDGAAHTANRTAFYHVSTHLAAARLTLDGQTALSGNLDTLARVDFPRLNVGKLFKLTRIQGLGDVSAASGTVIIEGPLAHPRMVHGDARLAQLQATVAGVLLRSDGGVHASIDHEIARLDPLHITGEDTDLHIKGSLSLASQKEQDQMDMAASGSINLKVVETLDPDLTANGNAVFQVEAHGSLFNPSLRGRVDFRNSSLALESLPNGLSQLNGTLEFNQNRLEVRSLTAMTGGGLLSVGGYLAYQHGIFANLTATGKGIRIRYPQGVSSLADATFRLQGMRDNLLLSGNVLITRFTVSPDLDIAALTAQTSSVVSIAPPDAPSNHIRLNVHITSSPQLNFQNAYAKLAGNVDLSLRGTVASPALLGRVSITEGSALLAGTRYELQRGNIAFTNPVRIQPVIDLIATARVEDYDITLSLHGTPQNLAVNYRSDPPLPESDVVALLALGRTESQQRLYTQQQEQYVASPATDALLGGALNATVSSRVRKLFGAASVKVDPNYLGILGNSTTRVIVEEQLGRNLTLTYATDVNTTGQQLIQADVAINRHVSLQLARDESGVFSVVFKATRRYR